MAKIPLRSRKYPGLAALVDDDQADTVAGYSWHPIVMPHTTYAATTVAGKRAYMHRMIMQAGPGQEVDHKDHDGLNNQRANLRLATRKQNGSNVQRSRANTSGYKGVSWDRKRGIWQAGITANGRRKNLGLYPDPAEAARAYDAAARVLHGEYARVNFPDETGNAGIRPAKVLMSRNSSGLRGVSWDKANNRWRASIAVDGIRRSLGRFDDPKDAAKAYDTAARKYHGDRAVLNFPS